LIAETTAVGNELAMEMPLLFWFGVAVTGSLLVLAGFLHLLPRLGGVGRAISEWCIRAPGLDLLVTVFTMLPWVAGGVRFGWLGVAVGVLGQMVTLWVWSFFHERAHADAAPGPRNVKVLNARVGRFRNHTAVWITALAVPMFWLVRLAKGWSILR
jgi:hypothetical protein